MIAFSGMCMALMVEVGGLPAWAAILLGVALAVAIGAFIGFLVIRTGLPSFIVSLGFFFMLRGATLVVARGFHDSTQVGGLGDEKNTDFLAWLVGGDSMGVLFRWLASLGLISTLPNGNPAVSGIPMIVWWWIGLGLVGALVLNKTFWELGLRYRRDRMAAKSRHYVDRVRISSSCSPLSAAIFAAAQIHQFGSADGNRGREGIQASSQHRWGRVSAGGTAQLLARSSARWSSQPSHQVLHHVPHGDFFHPLGRLLLRVSHFLRPDPQKDHRRAVRRDHIIET
jgi:simple sugar transport system permease protein